MTSKDHVENTIYSSSINKTLSELSYDDLVCLKYLLTINGSSKRLQRPEYEEILSDDAKMVYSAIIKRYKSMVHYEMEMLLHNRNRAKMYSKRILKHNFNKWTNHFLRNQQRKIEEALNQLEQDRQVESDLNDLLNKLLPVE